MWKCGLHKRWHIVFLRLHCSSPEQPHTKLKGYVQLTYRTIRIPVLLLFALLVMHCAPPQVVVGTKTGNQAPEISLMDVEGNSHTLSSLQGKLVLIEFWDAANSTARRNHFEIQRVYNKYKQSNFSNGNGFAVYSINIDPDAASWNNAVKEDGIVFPAVVHDPKGWNSAVVSAYGITSLPKYFLINEKGIIINHNILIPDLDRILTDQM